MIVKEIINRRSIRDFKTDAVSDDLITEIIKAAQLAPTAMNNKSVEFIIIKNNEIREEIFKIVGQDFIKIAPVLIIPAVDIQQSTLPVQDISLATENMFLQAAALGLGTIWKSLTDQWAKKIKTLLQVPNNFLLINIIPVGWPQKPLPPHSESEFNVRKLHFDSW